MEVIYQGHVNIDGSTRITCTTSSLIITSIIINNTSSDYVFKLNRFMTGDGIHEIPLYELHLSLGDSIRDTEPYTLYKGNYLELHSNVIGTTYYIKATQVE